MITFTRGDSTNFETEKLITIYVKSDVYDVSTWFVRFVVFGVEKVVPYKDGSFVVKYTGSETQNFPLGQSTALIALIDKQGNIRTASKDTPVNVTDDLQQNVEQQINIDVPTVNETEIKIDITTSDYNKLSNKPSINGIELVGNIEIDIPTKTSDLINDSGYITNLSLDNYTTTAELEVLLENKVDKIAGKGLSKNDFTDELKNKLEILPNTLPVATTSSIGCVKVDGETIIVSSDGTISSVGGGGTIKIQDATETQKGVIEIADNSEADSGLDNKKAMTPATVSRIVSDNVGRGLVIGFDGTLSGNKLTFTPSGGFPYDLRNNFDYEIDLYFPAVGELPDSTAFVIMNNGIEIPVRNSLSGNMNAYYGDMRQICTYDPNFGWRWIFNARYKEVYDDKAFVIASTVIQLRQTLDNANKTTVPSTEAVSNALMNVTTSSSSYGIKGDYLTSYGMIECPNGLIKYPFGSSTITIPAGIEVVTPPTSQKTMIASDTEYEVQATTDITLFIADGSFLEVDFGQVFYQVQEPQDSGSNFSAWWNPQNPNKCWQFKSNDTGNMWREAENATPIADIHFTSGNITRIDYVGYRHLDNSLFAEKEKIVALAETTELEHNTIYRGNTMSSLTLTLPLMFPSGFICEVDFTSGTTATKFTAPDTIKWIGNDLTDGLFVPTSNKRYNIMFYYDGTNINGVVIGIKV